MFWSKIFRRTLSALFIAAVLLCNSVSYAEIYKIRQGGLLILKIFPYRLFILKNPPWRIFYDSFKPILNRFLAKRVMTPFLKFICPLWRILSNEPIFATQNQILASKFVLEAIFYFKRMCYNDFAKIFKEESL